MSRFPKGDSKLGHRQVEGRLDDQYLCKKRHLIENCSCKLKDFKRIILLTQKPDSSFKTMIYASAALINARGISTGLSAPHPAPMRHKNPR
ncbi:MAG: hypothetical protein Q4G24_15015 [Paracoccus sp. (in: a-proteobacteria)]|uniref:hypothetical protein n=1 Tax=Paracoccus sp. TaxID=267 RepID=UPI0026E074D4|nr:hypothetical protein [Paracoccus sp. (in: a-proteobacteria)]MDO5622763.1 hypothetical protein [Paracoccus sp. (in: a-proteobacteria)]